MEGFDRQFYPLYVAIAEAGVPALFHTGQTGIGASCPAAMASNTSTRCCSTTTTTTPTLSGWAPNNFAPQLVKAANSMLRGKVLFGSDFPVIQVDRWMKDFENLDIEPEVAPLIVKRNALRVLGIRQFMWVITGWMTGYGHF